MKKFVNIVLFAILVFATISIIQCKKFTMEPEYPEFVKFINNSDITVYVIQDEDGYPDSIVPKNRGLGDRALPKEQTSLYCWGSSSRDEYLADNPTIQLFVCDLRTYSPGINLQDLVLKRYVLTREWLEQHNWTVTYP